MCVDMNQPGYVYDAMSILADVVCPGLDMATSLKPAVKLGVLSIISL